MTKQEIEEDKLSKDNINEDEINPYHNIIINNVDKEIYLPHKWDNGWYSVT